MYKKSIFSAWLVFLTVPFLFIHQGIAQSVQHIKDLIVYDSPTYESLQGVFDQYSYDIQKSMEQVPAIAPSGMPQNLKDAPVKIRKKLFIQIMIPLIVQANTHIIAERKSVQNLSDVYTIHGVLNDAQNRLLQMLAKRYKATGDMEKILSTLQYRVQPIPVGLVLAQAIIESGWGTSRFALEGNSLFGQWTFTTGSGLIPENRDIGKNHAVKAFDTPYDSVVSYMINLNRHRAYEDLRSIRYMAFKNNQPITAHDLAAGLEKYSQLGFDYVVKIRNLIQFNKLEKYNTADIYR